MRSNKTLIGCGIVVIVVLVLAIASVVAGNLLIPDVSQQIPSGINSVFVNVTQPVNGITLPLNQPVAVFVEAFGDQPIHGIQLFVDGVPLPEGSLTPAGGKKMMASWAFTPVKEGIYTLLAHANTQNGQDSISNIVNINILPPDKIPLPLALGGTTLPLVINDETGQTISEAELVEGASIPPPPGFNDQGGVDNPPPPPPEPDSQDLPDEPSQQPGGNLIPIKYSLWAQNLTKYFIDVNLPAAPKLDGGANQCDGILVVQDNSTDELGFFLYRLSPGKQTFDQVATLDGKAGKTAFSYHDPGLASGKYLYYLSAFNAAGEAASNITSFTVDAPQCATAKPPEFGEKSILIDPAQMVDKAYCYSSASGMPWVRLPFGQDNFIYPVNGKVDLTPYWNLIPLPQPTPPEVTLNMDCWGWSGTALIYLGNSSHTFGGGGDPTQEPNLDGTLGEPPKNLIAAPYNVTISDDPNVCKDHVPHGDVSAEEQCWSYMANSGGFLLVWTYNRFGTCNPQTENCDEDLQPADRFHIYKINQGKAVNYPLQPLGQNFTYVPAMEYGEYFVRAKSDTYGESGDSNHVLFPQPVLETTIKPSYIDHRVWRVWNYDGSVPHWAIPAGLMPDEMLLGYAFTCLNSCSIPQYRDGWYTGVVNFYFPENMDIQSARLNWENSSYITSGPGDNNTFANCGVHLKTVPEGIPVANSLMMGSENYDVTQPVLLTKLKGLPAINFSFVAPMELKPGVRWDRCLWKINNLSLTLYYHSVGSKYIEP